MHLVGEDRGDAVNDGDGDTATAGPDSDITVVDFGVAGGKCDGG